MCPPTKLYSWGRKAMTNIEFIQPGLRYADFDYKPYGSIAHTSLVDTTLLCTVKRYTFAQKVYVKYGNTAQTMSWAVIALYYIIISSICSFSE